MWQAHIRSAFVDRRSRLIPYPISQTRGHHFTRGEKPVFQNCGQASKTHEELCPPEIIIERLPAEKPLGPPSPSLPNALLPMMIKLCRAHDKDRQADAVDNCVPQVAIDRNREPYTRIFYKYAIQCAAGWGERDKREETCADED